MTVGIFELHEQIHKIMDTTIAFTQEYYGLTYPLRNVSTLSMVQVHPKDTILRGVWVEKVS